MSATAHMDTGRDRKYRGKRHKTRWRALEIIAIVLGFVIWWPLYTLW